MGELNILRQTGLLPDNTYDTRWHVSFQAEDGSWFRGNELSQDAINWLKDHELGFAERMKAVLLAESDYLERQEKERRISEYERKNPLPKKYIPKPGSIYVIRVNKTNKYKIGYTTGLVKDRVKNHQVSCPDELFLIHDFDVPDCVEAETQIHRNLKKYRKQGEWFDVPSHILTNVLKPYRAGRFHGNK